LLNIMEAPLIRALIDETIPFFEVMNSFGVKVTIANLPPSILGFTYISRKGKYHLVLNGNINHKTQCKTFVHELKHIITDMPKMSYYIGMDKQKYKIEFEADLVSDMLSLKK